MALSPSRAFLTAPSALKWLIAYRMPISCPALTTRCRTDISVCWIISLIRSGWLNSVVVRISVSRSRAFSAFSSRALAWATRKGVQCSSSPALARQETAKPRCPV